MSAILQCVHTLGGNISLPIKEAVSRRHISFALFQNPVSGINIKSLLTERAFDGIAEN